jgi:hypothetical protein
MTTKYSRRLRVQKINEVHLLLSFSSNLIFSPSPHAPQTAPISFSHSLISRWRCTRSRTPPISPPQIPSRARSPRRGPWPPPPPPRTLPPPPLPVTMQTSPNSNPLPSPPSSTPAKIQRNHRQRGCVGQRKTSTWRRWPRIKPAGSAGRRRWTGVAAAWEVERQRWLLTCGGS